MTVVLPIYDCKDCQETDMSEEGAAHHVEVTGHQTRRVKTMEVS